MAKKDLIMDFSQQPVIAAFVQSIKNGYDAPKHREILCLGTRGDGKTIGVLDGMVEHAKEHYEKGYSLPTTWIGVADTFTSHKLKTVKSLINPIWGGAWKLSDGDHVARFFYQGFPLVHLDLFGIEDQGAMDRVRMECVGVWFEEPAPSAVMVQSTGISEDAWSLALTSQRIASHFHPAVATSNYPDEDHWTWQRWKPSSQPVFANPNLFREILDAAGIPWPKEFDKYPNGTPVEFSLGWEPRGVTRWFRVPAGERASHSDRVDWARSLKNRPDMLRRLILGQPGAVSLGDQVAAGFSRGEHTTRQKILYVPGEPLYFGFDFGHTPTCAIGQPVYINGYRVLGIKAALHTKGGIRQLMQDLVVPWLSRFAPWVKRNPDDFALISYDPSQGSVDDPKGSEADAAVAALTAIKDELGGGQFELGPIDWDSRSSFLKDIFGRRNGLIIEENEFTIDLIRALDGRWYYPKTAQGNLRSDRPKKPNHPWEDLGDALIYLLSRYAVVTGEADMSKLRVASNRK